MKKHQFSSKSAESSPTVKINPEIITTVSPSTLKKDKITLPIISAPPKGISVMFNIPTGVLANWRWQGVGPRYYKRKRRIMYFVEDVISFLKEYPVLTSDSLPKE